MCDEEKHFMEFSRKSNGYLVGNGCTEYLTIFIFYLCPILEFKFQLSSKKFNLFTSYIILINL